MNITREVPEHLQADYDRIIKELKRTRQRKEVSQADIAEKCGISFTTVSAIERGIQNCSTTTLIGYLWALNLTYSDLEPAKPNLEPKISPAVQDKLETLSHDQQEKLMNIPSGLFNLMELIPEEQQKDLAKISPELLKRLIKMPEEQQDRLTNISPKLLDKLLKLTEMQQDKLLRVIDTVFEV
ncbi:MAG: helix-turn-helix transcriptional regulator [Lachnospiraceae bacterium]|nr:helix-turn-helix transcriptional regulator [Lachnospiraceae bacterium]